MNHKLITLTLALLILCSSTYGGIEIKKVVRYSEDQLRSMGVEDLKGYMMSRGGVETIIKQSPELFRELAMKIALDSTPHIGQTFFISNIFERLDLEKDKNIIGAFLSRTGADEKLVKKAIIGLLLNQPEIAKMQSTGILDISHELEFTGLDLAAERWKTPSSSFSIKNLKTMTDQGFKVKISKDGTITLTPVAGDEVTARGDIKASKEGGAIKLESGSIVQGKIAASIPREGKCPDCSLVINQKGQIEARGSNFPLLSAGKLFPAGTLTKGSAILGENYIQLVGGAQFQNLDGVTFTVTRNTAYFDDPSKYSQYRHQWNSNIFSYIDKKAGAAELEINAGKENNIEVSYMLKSEMGYAGKDKSGRPLYDWFTYGPYKRVTIGRGEGTAMVNEFATSQKGERVLASRFGYGTYTTTETDLKTGKRRTVERRGEFFTQEGLPSTAVKIRGDPSRDIPDKYLINNKGVWGFGVCKDPKGCWAAIPAIDRTLTARKVGIGEGSRLIALREGGIDTTAAFPEQAIGDYLEKVRSGIGSDATEQERNARLDKLRQISDRLAEVHDKEIKEITSSGLTAEEKTSRILEKLEDYWKHFAPGGYDGGVSKTTKSILAESFKTNDNQLRDAVTDFLMSKIQADDIDLKNSLDPWPPIISILAATYTHSGDSDRRNKIMSLTGLNPTERQIFIEIYQNQEFAQHEIKILTDANYQDSPQASHIQIKLDEEFHKKIRELDPDDPLRKRLEKR